MPKTKKNITAWKKIGIFQDSKYNKRALSKCVIFERALFLTGIFLFPNATIVFFYEKDICLETIPYLN